MTTAAQHLAAYDITIDEAHTWLLDNLGNPPLVLAACQELDLDIATLAEIASWGASPVSVSDVRGHFALFGVNCAVLEPPPLVFVLDSGDAVEGGTLTHEVTFWHARDAETHLPFTMTSMSISLSDLAGYSLSNGVAMVGSHFVVPAGVSGFTIGLQTTNDRFAENDEGYSLSVGSVYTHGTIIDDDTGPDAIAPLIPVNLSVLRQLASLNENTGVLSTSALRAGILGSLGESDYWSLFDATVIDLDSNGKLSADELGFERLGGDLPATAETLESIFYGTMINAMKAIDGVELANLASFAITYGAQLDAGNQATLQAYKSGLLSAMSDAAFNRSWNDSEIAARVVQQVPDVAVQVIAGDTGLFDAMIDRSLLSL